MRNKNIVLFNWRGGPVLSSAAVFLVGLPLMDWTFPPLHASGGAPGIFYFALAVLFIPYVLLEAISDVFVCRRSVCLFSRVPEWIRHICFLIVMGCTLLAVTARGRATSVPESILLNWAMKMMTAGALTGAVILTLRLLILLWEYRYRGFPDAIAIARLTVGTRTYCLIGNASGDVLFAEVPGDSIVHIMSCVRGDVTSVTRLGIEHEEIALVAQNGRGVLRRLT